MIKHIVMWKLREFSEGRSKAENMQAMKNMLEALNGKIPGLEKLGVGLGMEGSAYVKGTGMSRGQVP